jgi:DHA1 family bicyclomycin/chloramphenicol resistance-like MFS transporter
VAKVPPKGRFFLMIGGLSLFGPLCIDMYIPALPRLTADLHASTSSIQLSLTTCLIGLGLGQLLIGPASDRLGRRRPLLCGLAVFVVASVLCAFAPNATTLAGLRFVQGLGGSAGIVIARAIVRDLYSGPTAARFFSLLMLVTGAGPVFAPQIGAELLRLTSWRGVFVFLAGAGALLLVMAATQLPETLATDRRELGSLGATFASMRGVVSSRVFLANALACALGVGAIFAYISGSSFVMEDIYHLSPQVFSLLFAMNGCGLVAGARINAQLVSRFGSERLLTAALGVMATTGVTLTLVVLSGIGLGGILPCLFMMMFCLGFVTPNAMALALNDFPDAAGSASALIGLLQFSVGAAVAPLVGIAGNHDALPMALCMASVGIAAIVVRLILVGPARPARATKEMTPEITA